MDEVKSFLIGYFTELWQDKPMLGLIASIGVLNIGVYSLFYGGTNLLALLFVFTFSTVMTLVTSMATVLSIYYSYEEEEDIHEDE